MTIKNGDMPAMPVYQYDQVGDVASSEPLSNGLTKREMMAMTAMQALLTNSSGGYSDYKYMAQDAVTAADALLAELERTK